MTVFLIIISIIALAILIIVSSTLRIDIKELETINTKIIKLKIIISLLAFNKLKWIGIKIDKNRIEKIKKSIKKPLMNKILNSKIFKKYRGVEKIIIKDRKQILKELKNINIEKTKIEVQIGTENPVVTAYTVAIISTLLSILLARKTKEPKYEIKPVYVDKNYIHLYLNCIISIKLVHIINIKKELERKEVYQKYGRTSNRRTYANSNG